MVYLLVIFFFFLYIYTYRVDQVNIKIVITINLYFLVVVNLRNGASRLDIEMLLIKISMRNIDYNCKTN